MITLHALHYSRATRVLWLLADLGEPCHRVDYQRTENFRAPEALSRVHPLGKSPVIEDGNRILAESATILRYLVAKYGDETHTPPRGTPEFWQHEELLDYVESSFAEVALRAVLPAFRGKPVPAETQAALNSHLNFIGRTIGTGPMLFGERAMLADIQMSYVIALLARLDLLGEHPKVGAYWSALQAQPGYIAAVKAAGPMAPPG